MKKMGLLLTVVLILAFTISMTTKAASFKEDRKEFIDKQYRVMEEEFLSVARRILLEKGCKNVGLTLTYITDVQGNRTYTMTMHHARLDNMETREMTLLEGRLQERAEEILFTEIILKRI